MLEPQRFGALADHNGLFGEAERFAAVLYGADRAVFSVHRSTGANWMVLRMLSLRHPDAFVLLARNVHHSVINAAKAFGIDFAFLPASYDRRFETLLPPSPAEVADALVQHPGAQAMLFTSPTYEGLGARTEEITRVVHAHDPETLVLVDEAWGAHLPFHPGLPRSAIASGADVCVQSTHKLGGSLQQTGTLLWREDRIDSALIERAFAEYTTTSPSFHLLASLDATLRTLALRGQEDLEEVIARAQDLRARVVEAIPAVEMFEDDARIAAWGDRVMGHDATKVTLGLSRYELSGYEVRDKLLEHDIVPEKAGLGTLMLVATFQLAAAAPQRLARALRQALHAYPRDEARPLPPDPFATLEDAPLIAPYLAARRAHRCGRTVPLHAAAGMVAAEQVEVYPPGIPVILEGFRITDGAIDYLTSVHAYGGSVTGRDPSLTTVRVLDKVKEPNSTSERFDASPPGWSFGAA